MLRTGKALWTTHGAMLLYQTKHTTPLKEAAISKAMIHGATMIAPKPSMKYSISTRPLISTASTRLYAYPIHQILKTRDCKWECSSPHLRWWVTLTLRCFEIYFHDIVLNSKMTSSKQSEPLDIYLDGVCILQFFLCSYLKNCSFGPPVAEDYGRLWSMPWWLCESFLQ